MADRPLGEDPTTAVCDTGVLGGGVPAAPPLDFRDEQVVTDVIRDLMCRFSVQTSSYPCTKDEYGEFAFLDSSTVRQYCFQVPQTVVFPQGDTLLAAQIRDRYGNFGERREIVVRVGDVVPTGASGQIRYYNGDGPVPGADVLLVGTSPDSVLTSETGEFSFSGLNSGDWTLEPEKTGDFGFGVSSLDAAYILQVVVEKRTFTEDQELACDVTGNGALTSLDAAHILQFVTGKRARFQVAENCGSDWAFVPVPSVVPNQQIIDPAMQTGDCQRGAIAFSPLEGDVTGQDFHGVLFGDCTGNWQPPAGAGGAASRDIRAGNPAGWVDAGRRTRRRARISLRVDGQVPFHALEASLSYDVRSLRPLRARVTERSRGALVALNDSVPGLVTVALARANAIEGRGDAVLNLEFQALESRRAARGVRLASLVIDEVPVQVGVR